MQRTIIMGGMGVHVSTPSLAKIVSCLGGLGTVSGVASEKVMARILQMGDPGGHFRRALAKFPFSGVADEIIESYFVDGGIGRDQKFKSVPVFSFTPSAHLIRLTVLASFAFVWLAKEGHEEPVSVNYLEKVQIPHIFHLTGAMLAGVDVVTMGAGLTLQIPGVLDALSKGGPASYRVAVEGRKEPEIISFDPKNFFGQSFPDLKRPEFLPVVSTDVLASLMVSRLPARSIQGFVVEFNTAGGHNAPPRGKLVLNDDGEPVYGSRDQVDFGKIKSLGLPFWLGGSFASPEGLLKAKSFGATGIQAGSLFALCDDSGLDSNFRREIRRLGFLGELIIRTDPKASPTGFPFKVAQLPNTLSDPVVYDARQKICDLGALTIPYDSGNGKIGFRCSGEPVDEYIRKGGNPDDTIGVRCICNGLVTACGLGNPNEPPIFTLGDDFGFLRHLMKSESDSYLAKDAFRYLENRS